MKQEYPTNSQLLRSCVWPTAFALLLMSVMLVERLQVDWTASCSLQTEEVQACATEQLNELFGWAPAALAFALAHIWGSSAFYGKSGVGWKVGFERSIRMLVFGVAHFIPEFGGYLFLVGIVGGFLISLTIVGMLIAPFFGVFVAGLAGGALLAFAAGPPFFSGFKVSWRRHIWFYGFASGLSAIVLQVGQIVLDPAFYFFAGQGRPWLTSFVALYVVAISCLIVGAWAVKAHFPAFKLFQHKSALHAAGFLTAVVCALSIFVVGMVMNGVTVFGQPEGNMQPLARFFRGYKPPLSTPLQFAGLDYVGGRDLIIKREMTSRDRMASRTVNKGTRQETNEFWTVFDTYQQWRVKDPSAVDGEAIYIIADQGGDPTKMYCNQDVTKLQLCQRSPNPIHEKEMLATTRVLAFNGEDTYEFSGAAPNAALGIQFDAKTQGDGTNMENWSRLYCRLNLLSVTKARFSVYKIVSCRADWTEEEKRIRSYVESLFSKN